MELLHKLEFKQEPPEKQHEVKGVWSRGFDPDAHPAAPVFTENLQELRLAFESTLVPIEFYMPMGLHQYDKRLDANFWQETQRVIRARNGILRSRIKEAHHIQIIPSSIALTDEQFRELYFPGVVYKLTLLEFAIENGGMPAMTSDLSFRFSPEFEYGQISVDLNSFDEDEGIKRHPEFRKLQDQNCTKALTIREYIIMFRNHFKNSTGAKQVLNRKRMAMLSGKLPASMRNIFRRHRLAEAGTSLEDPEACAKVIRSLKAGDRRGNRYS